MLLEIVMIQFIVCFVVDVSGVMTTLKGWLQQWVLGKEVAGTDYRLRPFDCSLCMCFWTTLAYLLLRNGMQVSTLFLACVSACTADLMTTLIIGLREAGIRFFSLIK